MEMFVKGIWGLVFNPVIQLLTFTFYPESYLAAHNLSLSAASLSFRKHEVSASYVLGARNKKSENSSSLTHAHTHK